MYRAYVPLLLAPFLALLGALPAYAQLNTANNLSIVVNPQYPAPYSVVTVTPQSNLIDLNDSTVTITANGAVVSQGSGAAPAQVQLGGPGTKTVIVVQAVSQGQPYTSQVTLYPSDVSLVVEPVSTAHPFYLGAPLLASEGRVRIVALADLRTPDGASLSPSQLVYTWKNGDQILEGDSGIGKNVLTAIAPVRYRDADITVTVTSQDSTIAGQAEAVLTPVDPSVRLYRDDPLLGPWFNTALPDTVAMSDAEETFRAVAYFFTSLPSLSWTLNGSAAQSGPDITVRSTNGAGSAVLDASAADPSDGQTADQAMTVQFSAGRGLGIFGL